MAIALGIDTSNYTTSVALVNEHGDILIDLRRILDVKADGIGLRQSEAFYQHVMHLPELINQLPQELLSEVCTIGVSSKPRPVEGSYMPVFKAGEQFALVLSKALEVPIFLTTHQEGHIAASIINNLELLKVPAISLHASGGTTEFLMTHFDPNHQKFHVEIVGGTKDVSFGQIIDRVGVTMGFAFPCGKAMESALKHFELPAKWLVKMPKSFTIPKTGAYFNLSGWENQAKKALLEGYTKEEVIYLLFHAIAQTITSGLESLLKNNPVCPVIFAGGVMSNIGIQAQINQFMKLGYPEHQVHMGVPSLCTDNATGVAYLASMKYGTLL